jgi:hypothetical protein
MGKSSLETYYLCAFMPLCTFAIASIAMIFMFGNTTWDQDVLDQVNSSWKTKVIEDIAIISSTQSCATGYSAVTFKFDGTKNLCEVTYDNSGRFYYTLCESYTTGCDNTSDSNCRGGDKPEGISHSGMSDQYATIFNGAIICLKRGDYDYYDFAEDRKTWSQDNNVIACDTTENQCGGSSNSTLDKEYRYCYKPTSSGFTCPVQDFTSTNSYSSKKGYSLSGTSYTDDRTIAPLYDIELDM